VTQLWYIIDVDRRDRQGKFYRYQRKTTKTIAIEQPELHLHPALQAKLIDIIAKIAEENDVRFIIETHSETMINRIGTLIYKKKLDKNDVDISIFDKKFGDVETHVSKSTFDDEGYLENWPIGFFEPEEE
jgi:predicted ATPase